MSTPGQSRRRNGDNVGIRVGCRSYRHQSLRPKTEAGGRARLTSPPHRSVRGPPKRISGEAYTFAARQKKSRAMTDRLCQSTEACGGAERQRSVVGKGSLGPARAIAASKNRLEYIARAIACPACGPISKLSALCTAIGERIMERVGGEIRRTSRERALHAPELEVTKRHQSVGV